MRTHKKTNITSATTCSITLTKSYHHHALAATLTAIALSAATTAIAMPIEERGSTPIDSSMPIAALDKLQSLKNTEQLNPTFPKIQHFTTDNGVPVSFVQTNELPIVDISLKFNAGSARDTAIRDDGFGIANMTATMLSQGTAKMDENAFAAATEQLGINLGAGAYKDMFAISLRSLSDSEHLDPALSLMQDMLKTPRFDREILERNKAQLMLGLQQQQQDPGSIAGKAFMQALYQDHPYAHPTSGTLETVPSISQADLQQFWQQFLVASNASIAMTGDMTLKQAQQVANQLTAILPQGKKAAALPTPTPLSAAQRIDIPFDSSQTTVIIGQIGEQRSADPKILQQQTNFSIGNDILAGGDFNARLMTEVRKKRGYTYGIYGHMTPMLTKGPYTISFSTRNDKAEDAIATTLDTINHTLDKGVTHSEVALTKENMKNSFPMSYASNAGINATIGMMNFYQLPDSYLSNYTQRIDTANTETINTALNTTLTPDEFLIVTVGSPTKSAAAQKATPQNSQSSTEIDGKR
ncbi:M16 family metallopeptidase [Psychrobacter sp. I-STPA10]|uniref:M16 family metallopeptidase n=1 Tax=Psychrobacter sp. I-STPA10 TaxID=2585769 RepID=UPI001E564736|nr:pitrilysin family protein [Psychrobacter sp. I-STPA10]